MLSLPQVCWLFYPATTSGLRRLSSAAASLSGQPCSAQPWCRTAAEPQQTLSVQLDVETEQNGGDSVADIIQHISPSSTWSCPRGSSGPWWLRKTRRKCPVCGRQTVKWSCPLARQTTQARPQSRSLKRERREETKGWRSRRETMLWVFAPCVVVPSLILLQGTTSNFHLHIKKVSYYFGWWILLSYIK